MNYLFLSPLKTIENIIFTKREIDVIACIMHAKSHKKIASILAVSPRTVSFHVSNILTKTGATSRDCVIELLEKSGQMQYIRQHYHWLLEFTAFEQFLKKIKKNLKLKEIEYPVKINSLTSHLTEHDRLILKSLKNHLRYANILLKISTSKGKLVELNKFTENIHYYAFIIELLQETIKSSQLNEFIIEFKKIQGSISLNQMNSDKTKNSTENRIETKKNSFKSWRIIFSSVAILFIFGVAMLTYIKNNSLFAHQIAWNLPSQIPHFIERRSITKEIWKIIKQNNMERNLVGLHGLGGVGKTTLAINVIHYPNQKYIFRGWFPAENTDLLEANYFELGEKYNLFVEGMSKKQKILKIKEFLEKQPTKLLIYDNVPDMHMIEEYLPKNGNIIVTSRNFKLPGAVEIDVMEKEIAVQLLNKLFLGSNIDHYNKADVSHLADVLGYFPLALSQAGAYITENKLTIDQYLSLYKTEKDKLLSSNTLPVLDHHAPAYLTWDMALHKLQESSDGEKAISLLELISVCYPEDIPKQLIVQYLYNEDSPAAIIKMHEQLNVLRRYSLVKISSNAISVHRLVHSWLQDGITKQRRRRVIENGISSLKVIYPWKTDGIPEINFIKQLFPHAMEMLSQENPVKKSFTLTRMVGDACFKLGFYQKSKDLYQAAYDQNTTDHKLNNIEQGVLLRELGKVELAMGNYDIAKQRLEGSLSVHQEFHKQVETTTIFDLLGKIYYKIGKPAEAEKILLKSISIKEKFFPKESLELVTTLNELGKTYIMLGEHNKSIQVLERALIILKKRPESSHLKIAAILESLGWARLHLGENRLGKEEIEKAYLMKKNHYGDNHLETAQPLRYLGWAYMGLGEYFNAKKILEKSASIYEHFYGSEHIETSFALQVLAQNLIFLGQYEKAKEILLPAMKMQKKYPINSTFLLHILGWAYHCSGNYKEAQIYFEDTLNFRNKYYPENHVYIAYIEHSIALLHNDLGDYDKAKQLSEAAHQKIEKNNLPEEIETGFSWLALGQIYRGLGKYEDAKKIFGKALFIGNKHYGAENIFTISVIENMAFSDLALGNVRESKNLLKENLRVSTKIYGQNHEFTAKSLANLGNAYRVLQKYKKSKDMLENAYSAQIDHSIR